MGAAEVRDATVDDAAAMAALQLDVWRTVYVSFLPPQVLEQLDQDSARQSWERAIGASGDAHLLVATESGAVVGFGVAIGAEIATLLVAPRWSRRGHGGRLLGTLSERLASTGASHGEVWVPEGDEAARAFFPAHRWRPDGTVRTSHHGAPGAAVLHELRHTGPLTPTWI
ncbi:MAG: N-acetyltransferase family protein [Mycobacteriaceae bacterium]